MLLSAIRVRLASFFLIISKLLNPQYLRLTLQQYVGTFFRRLLDVKPRDKKDYYTLFNWMFSKRLAYSVVIIVGVLCAFYIFMVSPARLSFAQPGNASIPTYKYNSWGVKNFTGQANILAKSKYTAYTGNLVDGVISGSGKLFDKSGNLVYEGEFQDNQFNGKGQLYYTNGNVEYAGDFVNNDFQGTGTLYRPNVTIQYEGGFSAGLMHGDGMLYDETADLIYTGKFENGELSYATLLNKTTAEIAESYTGRNIIYNFEQGGDYCVYMSQIGAISVVNPSVNSILDAQPVDKIMILKDSLAVDRKVVQTLEDLDDYFDKKIYEGLSMMQAGEVAAFLNMNDKDSGAFLDRSTVDMERPFEEVYTVFYFDVTKEIYIRTYLKDGLAYTFYYADKNSPFVMYSIETAVVQE